MGKVTEYEKILKKWLKKPFFTGRQLCSVDESVVSLLVLSLYCREPGKRLLLETPGFALGEKIRGELLQWAVGLGLTPRVLLLPDGSSGGKKLMESEIPRAKVLDEVLNNPPDILIVSASAELSPAPAPDRMRRSELILKPGMELAPEKLAERNLSRLFGPRPRDHKSLRLMPPEFVDDVMHPLWKTGFSGVLNLEVFSVEDFTASHAVLMQSWERYAASS